MRIKSLTRFPVKSLLGENCQQLELDGRGIAGDRVFAVSDRNGKLGSGKTTNRFARMDGLFSLQARTRDTHVSVSFPGGELVDIDAPDLNNQLSRHLDRDVTVVPESDIPHFDDGPVHLLLSSELARLQGLMPEAQIDHRRFRANVVLDAPDHMRDEDLVGKVLTIGDTKLEVTHATERCRMVTMSQEDLGFDPAILKTIVQQNEMNFGLYAKVIQRGRIQVGQTVNLAAERRSHRIRDSLR